MLLEKDQPRWARVPDAARHFNIPRTRMYQLIHDGEVPAVRLGERSIRVDLREAEQFLKDNRRVVS
jgi:excisionase family DNA binding protein